MPIHGLSNQLQTYPPHFDIEKVIRPNILALHPYRCARDDYQEGILLDANENALGHSIPRNNSSNELDAELDVDLHRYPDPAQVEIKTRIAQMRGLPGPEYVFLGVGSDEVIDLLMRVCCGPGKEKVLISPPTYGMYSVCAQVNDLGVVKVPLETAGGAFQVRIDEMKKAVDEDSSIKLIFLCSPGNPTGTLIPVQDVVRLLEYPGFKGVVVVDEAYIDFAGQNASAASLVTRYANLCVMQTLSKSFGLAAIRLGLALSHPALIQVLTNTKAPYNISTPSSMLALRALSPEGISNMHAKIATLLNSRAEVLAALAAISHLGIGAPLGGNHANFVLIPILDTNMQVPDSKRAAKLYKILAEEKGVVVRYRGSELGCDGCLRITIGTEQEIKQLIQRMTEVLGQI